MTDLPGDIATDPRSGGVGLAGGPPPSRRGRPSFHGPRRGISSTEVALLSVLAVAAGIGGVLADGAPTGYPALDAAWRFVFAAGFTLLHVPARRWTWITAALVPTLMSRPPVTVVGVIATIIAAVGSAADRRSRVLGAVAGALSVQVMLRTDPFWFHGSSALVTACLFAMVAVSAYRNSRSAARQRVRLVVLVTVGLMFLLAGVAFLSAMTVRGRIDAAVTGSLRALDDIQGGDEEDAATRLDRAADRFDSAADVLGAWWLSPSRLLPVVSQHLRASETMSRDGESLARNATTVARSVDFDTLRRPDGSFDLGQLAGYSEPLERSLAALDRTRADVASVSSPWLLAPVANRLQNLGGRLDSLTPTADLTAQASRIIPGLLGGDGPRRYFLMLVTPSESRALSGHMGNWAELSAEGGSLSVARSGRTLELIPNFENPPEFADPDSFPQSYLNAQPNRFPQNLAETPDLPTVLRAVSELYPQFGGQPVDGVVTVDPYGFAAMLELTGPVRPVPGGPELTAENAAQFLLFDQYSAFPDESTRGAFLDTMVREVIPELTSQRDVTPRQVLDALAPAVRSHRIRFLTDRAAEAAFLERTGLASAMRPPSEGDQLAVISSNRAPNKADAYLHRTIRYEVGIDAEQKAVVARLTVQLRNDTPTTGPTDVVGNGMGLPDGTNVTSLDVYTPLNLTDLQIDGHPGPAAGQDEFGLRHYSTALTIPAGGTVTVTYELTARVTDVDAYRLRVLHQPLANDDSVEVTVSDLAARPWRSPTDGSTSFTLSRDTELDFRR